MAFLCFKCRKSVRTHKDLFRHLRHLSQQHPENESNDHTDTPETPESVTESSIEPTEVTPSDDDQTEVDPSDVWDELDEQSFTERVAIFLAKLNSVPRQTFTAINFVVQEASSLVSGIVGNLQRKTMLVLQRLGQNEIPEVQDLTREFERASVPFQGLDTEHKQMKFFV